MSAAETPTPLVSVLTPVHNTEEYLAECIESVLAQTYTNFEYVIVENQSTDASGEIADRYAALDDRIRVIRTPELLLQDPNHNFAASQASPEAAYVKFVQADDWLFPRCLEEMVAAAEAHPSASIITSYSMNEKDMWGLGLHPTEQLLTDGEAGRRLLLDDVFVFGSPTTVMYTGELVRSREPLYDIESQHCDTELCLDVLVSSDLVMVHQVLSFVRGQDDSVTGRVRDLLPRPMDRRLMVERHAHRYLSPEAAEARIAKVRADYYGALARAYLRSRSRPGFRKYWSSLWAYHEMGLARVDGAPSKRALYAAMPRVLVRALIPGA